MVASKALVVPISVVSNDLQWGAADCVYSFVGNIMDNKKIADMTVVNTESNTYDNVLYEICLLQFYAFKL